MKKNCSLFAIVLGSTLLNVVFSQVPKFTKVKIGTTTAWKDEASGLIIGKIKINAKSLQEAKANCPPPWRTPNFGNLKQMGAASDLEILFKNGVLSVYPDLIGKSFWLNHAPNPYYETIEFTEDSEHPLLYNYGTSDGSISSICISK